MEPANPSVQERPSSFERKLFATVKVLVAVSLVLLFLILAAEVFLLLFAGILFAIFLSSLAKALSKLTSLPYGWSVAITCLVLLLSLALLAGTAAPGVAEQLEELTNKIPQALNKIKSQIQQYSWSQLLYKEAKPDQLPDKLMESGGQVFSRVTGAVSGFVGSIASFGIILFIGLYGAAEPDIYKKGFLHLIPVPRRLRITKVIEDVAETLQWWIIGKCISMAAIGIFTTVGLWIMDIPLAFILGLIAALLTFIPNIGPILSAIPAILLGLMENATLALHIALLYIGIQLIESYVITPLIQRKTVSLPPGLTLGAQVLMGVLFGMLGVALATPLTAAALVLTKRLYLEDTLKDSLGSSTE